MSPALVGHIDASFLRTIGSDLGEPIDDLPVAAVRLDQPADRVATAPTLIALDAERVELAD